MPARHTAANNNKILFFTVPLIIYPFHLFVSIGRDDDELELLLQRKGYTIKLDKEHLYDAAVTNMFENGNSMIRLYKYPETPSDYGNLAHEIFHVAENTLEFVGMKLCPQSCEAYAYLIGYLTAEIYRKFKIA